MTFGIAVICVLVFFLTLADSGQPVSLLIVSGGSTILAIGPHARLACEMPFIVRNGQIVQGD